LDFLNSRQLDPRITFRRESDASPPVPSPGTGNHNGEVYLYPGNVPRLTDQGLLIEQQSTNRVTNSNDFNNYAQNPANSITVDTNAGTAPDGTNTAFRVYPAVTGNGAKGIYQGLGNLNLPTTTTSIFVKAANKDWVKYYDGYGLHGVWFNVATGTKGVEDDPITNATIVPVGNGWFRCSITRSSSQASNMVGISPCDGDGSLACTKNGTDGILVWGEQLEALDFSTSYIPTTGQAGGVTRAADVAEITGTNFSSWYNQNAGTFVAEGQSFGTQNGLLTVWGTNTNDRMVLGGVSANWQYQVRDDGTVEAELDSGSYDQTAFNKLAAAYQANNFGLSANGSTTVTDNNGDLPTVNRLQVAQLNGALYNSYVSKISYYPTRLPDDALEALTS